jgi:general secretion pathway protein D
MNFQILLKSSNNLRAVIDKLDVRRAQIFVEALIAEVSASKDAEFGVQWQGMTNVDNAGNQVAGGTNFGTGGNNIINLAEGIKSGTPTFGQGLNLGIVEGGGLNANQL